MIANLQPYPTYKPSGVECLGDAPAHWNVERLGKIGRLSKGNGGTKEDEAPSGIPCVRYGDLYTTHDYFIEKSRSFVAPDIAKAYTSISLGDVLFAGSGETVEEIGKSAVNLIPEQACCGGDVILFKPMRGLVSRFMGYATACVPANLQKAAMGRGITVMHIYGDQLKSLAIPLPPLPEQASIVRYLDHVDQRIQRYITAKEKLIALLEEEEQAIINQAVTRGLDPNVPLKPSGVEWLGDVPAHWEVRSLKWAFLSMDYGISDATTGTGSTRVLTMAHVSGGSVDVPQYGGVDFVEPRLLLQSGDLLFNRTNSQELVAKVGLFVGHDSSVTFASYLVRLQPSPAHEPEYLNFVLNDDRFLSSARREAIPSLHQSNLNPNRYGRLPIALPDKSEQLRILRFLNDETAEINSAISRSRRQIDLLEEYRTRLISDVVTGKLDVRETAANLPGEPSPAFDPDGLAQASSTPTGGETRHGGR